MKTFKLSFFKGANMFPITTKIVEASSREELQIQKNGFKSEHPSIAQNPRNWIGVKRVRK